MKFKFFNDTGRIVTIHQATYEHGCYVDNSDAIMPLQERLFFLPDGTYPFVKLWNYGARNGLQLLVSPIE
ncbi:hypothetical protein [Niallia sp. MER 6]|uniref:hypothetical protein n=1 Tax=Niallia sp. MER 6 TaxID=2939567 RepID=UPI002040FFD0|nr:hypothetical protein [Niallia sp. MER 6]MCM3031507.1 hypothetical protein [Niallia sp. MER 6]